MIKKCFCAFFCLLLSIVVPFIFQLAGCPAGAADVIPPQFYLSSWSGIRGSSFSIKGSAFTKSAVVAFYFSSDYGDTASAIDDKITAYRLLGSVWTNSVGIIDNNSQLGGNQAIYQVPFQLDSGTNKKNTPGGACYIYATYLNSKDVIAYVKFTVTSLATLAAVPESAYVGDKLTLTGDNFGNNENATAKLDDRDIAITSGNRTAATGAFSGTVSIPESTEGQHIIYITDETGNVGNDTITVLSRLILNTTSQAFGGKIVLTGTGFASRRLVTISINGLELTPEESPVTSSSYGSFQATVTVPFDYDLVKGGKALITASMGTATASADLNIIETSPALAFVPAIDSAYPANVGMPLRVTGTWFTPGDKVNLSIDSNAVFASAVPDAQGYFMADITLPPGKSGTHLLMANGTTVSASREYVMEGIPPSVPLLKSPRVTGDSGDAPMLEWTAVTDPSGVTYDLQIAADKDFNSLLIDKHGLTSGTYIFPPSESAKLIRGGAPCYWRVRAADGAMNTSDWTPASSFYVGFSWSSVPGWVIYAAAAAVISVLTGVFLYIRKVRSTVVVN